MQALFSMGRQLWVEANFLRASPRCLQRACRRLPGMRRPLLSDRWSLYLRCRFLSSIRRLLSAIRRSLFPLRRPPTSWKKLPTSHQKPPTIWRKLPTAQGKPPTCRRRRPIFPGNLTKNGGTLPPAPSRPTTIQPARSAPEKQPPPYSVESWLFQIRYLRLRALRFGVALAQALFPNCQGAPGEGERLDLFRLVLAPQRLRF